MKPMMKVVFVLALMAPWTGWAHAVADAEAGDRQETLQQELAEAQAELAEAARKLARIQRELVDHEGGSHWREVTREELSGEPLKRVLFIGPQSQALTRPRLGLVLGLSAAEADDDGDVVIAVTPGSGAERAGIRAGDRVVAINHQAIDPADSQSIQRPLAGIEPGDTVPVEIERGGELLAFDVEAGDLAGTQRAFVRRVIREQEGRPGEIAREALMVRPAGEHRERFLMSPPPARMLGMKSNTQLTGNHAGLESYFGTAEGVIVLRIDADNALKLASGDVILAVDGHKVARPMDVGMALMRLEVGEPVSLELVRGGQNMVVEATVPDGVMPGSWNGRMR